MNRQISLVSSSRVCLEKSHVHSRLRAQKVAQRPHSLAFCLSPCLSYAFCLRPSSERRTWDLSTVKRAEAKELRIRVATLISDEEQRREAHLRKAHSSLLEKVLSGKKLNKKERASFYEVCQLLLSCR